VHLGQERRQAYAESRAPHSAARRARCPLRAIIVSSFVLGTYDRDHRCHRGCFYRCPRWSGL